MAKVVIPLGGMSNVPDDAVAKDGDMCVLVNMRHEAGELVQRNPPRRRYLRGVKKVFYHGASSHLLAIGEDGKSIYDATSRNSSPTKLDWSEKRALTFNEVWEKVGPMPAPIQAQQSVNIGNLTLLIYRTGEENPGLDGNFVRITGNGRMPNFANAAAWIGQYNPKYIEITKGVTSIGDNAFKGLQSLARVYIPEGVTKIGNSAFNGCAALDDVVIPASVTEIKSLAFIGCSALTSIYFTGAEPPALQNALQNDCTAYYPYGLGAAYRSIGLNITEQGYIEDGFATDVSRIDFIGNVVRVTTEGRRIYYAIWKDGKYSFLGALPRKLNADVSVSHKVFSLRTKNKYFYDYTESRGYDNQWPHVKGGFFDELLTIIYNEKYYIDSAMFIVAARLFDGSYIQLTPMMYVDDKAMEMNILDYNDSKAGYNLGTKLKNFLDFRDSGSGGGKGSVHIEAMKIDILLGVFDFSAWSDFITSVDVFSTGSIMYHAKKAITTDDDKTVDGGLRVFYSPVTRTKYYGVSKNESYEKRTVEDVSSDISSALFYRVASYDLNGKLISGIENTAPSNIAVQQRLENLLPIYELCGGDTKLYNARLHEHSAEKVYYDMPVSVPNDTLQDWSRKTLKNVTQVVTIDTGAKEIKVINVGDINVNVKARVCYLPALISYPDARAKLIEFFIPKGGGVPATYKAFKLTESANGAIYMNIEHQEMTENYKALVEGYTIELDVAKFKEVAQPLYSGIEDASFTITKSENVWVLECGEESLEKSSLADFGVKVYAITTEGEQTEATEFDGVININYTAAAQATSCGELVPTPLVDLNASDMAYAIPGGDNIEKVDDVLYVSEVDNPFYYPYTYRFASPITAIESSAEEVSSGQFGQFPMNVFTGDGIWALAVDESGTGPYRAQVPISREVGKSNVCAITGGVGFASDRGVCVLSGSQVTNISKGLMSEQIIERSVIDKIARRAGIEVPSQRFFAFLQDSAIAYDYIVNELVVTSPYSEYNYRYNIGSAAWSIDSEPMGEAVKSYPLMQSVIRDGDNLALLTYDNSAPSLQDSTYISSSPAVLAISRPIKFGSTGRKRVTQAALRGTWLGEVDFYILGSNDGKVWSIVGGKEGQGKADEYHRDIVTKCNRSRSYEYIAFAIASKGFEGRLSCVEMLVDGVDFNNKLR